MLMGIRGPRPSRRLVIALAAVAAVVAAAAGGTLATRQHAGVKGESLREARLLLKNATAPGRIAKIEKGREASRNEIVNGPATEDYENRAYPSDTIAFTQQQQSLKDARKILKKQGVRFPQPWQSIGPDTLSVSSFGTQTYGPPTQWSGRVTSLAVDPKCNASACKLYLGAAGGGIWKSDNALSAHPAWKQISDGQIDSNSIGSLYVDPTDSQGRTIYAGTGEPNGSGDSEAGIGLFRSTDAGEHWSLVAGSVAVAKDRGIAAIAVDPANPQHLFIGTAVARHGSSSNNGGRFTPPGAPPVGLYESNDDGASFQPALIEPQDAVNPASPTGGDFFRGGVTKLQYDPTTAGTLYLSMFGYGLFRSTTNGASFDNIFADTVSPTDAISIRFEFAATKLPSGKTRLYLGAGWNEGDPTYGAARLYRIDDAAVPALTLTTGGTNGGWIDLSSDNPAQPGFGSFDFCEGQCSYDIFVASPAGRPDTVVLGGSMQYGELPLYGGADISNGRAVIQSTNAGVSFTDQTGDATALPGGMFFQNEDMHPDQHAIAFDPANPDVMFVGSDGGLIRTSGQYANNSAVCAGRGLSGQDLTNCQSFLSRIPTKLTTLNDGLGTLQFQSISVNPSNPLNDALGGTQDNGTLLYSGTSTWFLGITGDGGDSGFDAVNGDIRFHTYTNTFTDVNFRKGDPTAWVWTGDTMYFSGEASSFYAPMIADPVTGGQIFAGMRHVWRTQDSGGPQAFLEAHCNTTGVFGTSDQLFTGSCGDWVPLGTSTLTSAALGSKSGQYVVALGRGTDASTLWAATRRGRLFISTNANAASAAAVTFARVDTAATPTRFISSVSVDPANPLHAIVSFSGYNAYATAAGTVPGHVFDVIVTNPVTGAATWTNIDYDLGDQPILDAVFDGATGDVYASTDFGAMRLPKGQTSYIPVADGLPSVAVYGLTLTGGKKPGDRSLYAATHGRGAWRLSLPDVKK